MNFAGSGSVGSGILPGSGGMDLAFLNSSVEFCHLPSLRYVVKFTNNRVSDLKTKYLLLTKEGKREILVKG